MTFRGNCNGGVYIIPKSLLTELRQEWTAWSLRLVEDIEPRLRSGIGTHADQVGFCIALHRRKLPYQVLKSNFNYFTHFDASHVHFDDAQPIFVLHYHEHCMNDQGLLEPRCANTSAVVEAFAKANALIQRNFRNDLFWDLRYTKFPACGSGRGSRGENLDYKRDLLSAQKIEEAAGVLDIGCGDLEVLKNFDLSNYLGLDQSAAALEVAKAARPDWEFRQSDAAMASHGVLSRELVLCFEALIHQETEARYRALIEFACSKCERTLIVSGYETDQPHIKDNHLIFFYEPLSQSLAKTRAFRSIRQIGTHTDVVVFRCDK
jgi:hypothetical protein